MSHEHPTSSDQRVNQKRYDRNYLMIFGYTCPNCNGHEGNECSLCNGVGYVDQKRETRT